MLRASFNPANEFDNVIQFNAAAQAISPAIVALKHEGPVTAVAGNANFAARLAGGLDINQAPELQGPKNNIGMDMG